MAAICNAFTMLSNMNNEAHDDFNDLRDFELESDEAYEDDEDLEYVEPIEEALPGDFGTQLGFEVVDLYIGLDEKRFTVHKSLLCSKVPYFDLMFNGNGHKARGNSANLQNDSQDAFELFVEWLYTGRFQKIDEPRGSDRIEEMALCRIRVYELAERMSIPALADYVIDTYRVETYKLLIQPSVSIVRLGYSSTQPGSPLRKLLSTMLHRLLMASLRNGRQIVSDTYYRGMTAHKDVLKDVLLVFMNHSLPSSEIKPHEHLPKCMFHQHAEGEPCPNSTS